MFAVLNPTRRAGGNQRQCAAVLNTIDQLVSLFQDSQVCREVGIKYAVESQTVQCSGHLSFYNGSNRKSEAFAQTHTNGRCCLNDNELIRIFQCSLNLSGRILLIEGAHRASCHALSAVYAAGLCKRKVKGTSDVCIESTVVCADYADSLKVFTGSHASSAKNTFVVVSDDGFGAGIYAKRILLSGIATSTLSLMNSGTP